MPYEIVNNKDAVWQKFIVESFTKDLIWSDNAIQHVSNAATALHRNLPIVWLKLELTPAPRHMEIKFKDGRKWGVTFHERIANCPVSYDINGGQQWLRDLILQYITPLTAAVVSAYVSSIDTLDLRPR